MIKILIVDDSPTETELLRHIFEEEKDMHVIGCARNGKEAVELTAKLKPDLITMDLQMPIMDGIEATQLIMMENPVPIVVISAANNKSLNTTFLALEAGALSVIDKPLNAFDPLYKQARNRMIAVLRSMTEIKVIKKRFNTSHTYLKSTIPIKVKNHHSDYEIIAMGASIGGPQVLKTILSNLSSDFPIPIVIVQHISAGFITGFCEWLNDHCDLTIKCAAENEILKGGTVYFAPENYHLQVKRRGNHLVSSLQKSQPISGFCPSITVLFQSVANICGKKAIGILLTGMGSDGAQGLLEIKLNKGHTLIQDAKSSTVYGMAGIAEGLGAVDKIVEPDQFAPYLTQLLNGFLS